MKQFFIAIISILFISCIQKEKELLNKDLNYNVINSLIQYENQLTNKKEIFSGIEDTIQYGRVLFINKTTKVLRLNNLKFGIKRALPFGTEFGNFFDLKDSSHIDSLFKMDAIQELDTLNIKSVSIYNASRKRINYDLIKEISKTHNDDILQFSPPYLDKNNNALIGSIRNCKEFQIEKLFHFKKVNNTWEIKKEIGIVYKRENPKDSSKAIYLGTINRAYN